MEMIGVDGCRGGWALAVRAAGEQRVRFYVVERLDGVFAAAKVGRAVVAIDMPIGLPRCDSRACDSAAREFIGERHSSVFSVPCRTAVFARTRRDARRQNRQTMGKSITKQAFAIFGKVRDLDRLIRPRLQDGVFETHPEVVFAVLNGRTPMVRIPAHHEHPFRPKVNTDSDRW